MFLKKNYMANELEHLKYKASIDLKKKIVIVNLSQR